MAGIWAARVAMCEPATPVATGSQQAELNRMHDKYPEPVRLRRPPASLSSAQLVRCSVSPPVCAVVRNVRVGAGSRRSGRQGGARNGGR